MQFLVLRLKTKKGKKEIKGKTNDYVSFPKAEAFKGNILFSKTCFSAHTRAKNTRSELKWLCAPPYPGSRVCIALPPSPGTGSEVANDD